MNIKFLKKTLVFAFLCASISMILLLFSLFMGITSNQIISVMSLTLIFTFGFLYKHTWIGKLSLTFAIFIIILQSVIYQMFLFIIFLMCSSILLIGVNLILQYTRKVTKTRTYNIQQSKNKTTPAHIKSNHWFESYDTAESFEWENINISTIMGDTIINLTNTILPENTNIISIHKAIGNTRIIVPVGVGVSLMASSLYSAVDFMEENYALKQEQLILYSDNYIQSSRKVKIIVTTYIGDVEIIRL